MEEKSFSRKDALNFGWKTFHQNYELLIGVFLVFALVVYMPPLISALPFPIMNQVDPLIGNIVLEATSFILSIFLTLGIINITLRLADKKSATWSDMVKKSYFFDKLLLGTIIYSIMTLIGLIAFIVPGIYIAIKYYFYTYYIVDKGMGPIEAIRQSGALTTGHKWNLLILFVILAFINLLAALPPALIAEDSPVWVHMITMAGLLITMPISYLALAYTYRKLEKNA